MQQEEIMKKIELFLKMGLILMALVCVGFGACSFLNKKLGLSDNNIIEEQVEEVIKDKTGLDVDLSETPEG